MTDGQALSIFDIQAALYDLWESYPQSPPSTLMMSVETAAALDYWIRRYRRRGAFRIKQRRRRAIGRGHW